MFEVLIQKAVDLKKIIDAIRELIGDANIYIDSEEISLSAMDSSHVSLIELSLISTNFEEYRCDRPRILGIPINNL